MSLTQLKELVALEGRAALVTGAGQGVGLATARMLAGQGARVAVNDFHVDRAESAAAALRAEGADAFACAADVTDHEAVVTMVSAINAEFGPIDILVNNAGNAGPNESPLAPSPPFWEVPVTDWDKWLGVNLFGVMNCTHAVTPGMIEGGGGRVITLISDAGRVGEPNLVVYSGAKAGAAGFMRGYAKAVARHKITANCVALGAIMTPPVAAALADDSARAKVERAYPLQRLGQPEDPAALITFLASDAGSWMTGQTIPVNGGYSMAV